MLRLVVACLQSKVSCWCITRMSTFKPHPEGRDWGCFPSQNVHQRWKNRLECGLEFDFFTGWETNQHQAHQVITFNWLFFFCGGGGSNTSPCHGAIFPLLQLSAKRNKATASTPFESKKVSHIYLVRWSKFCCNLIFSRVSSISKW